MSSAVGELKIGITKTDVGIIQEIGAQLNL